MEKLFDSAEKKEVKKEGWMFRTMRNFVMGSMMLVGGELARETIVPGFENIKTSDNWREEGNPEETVKRFFTLQSGSSVYRTVVDFGIKKKDAYKGGSSMGKMPLISMMLDFDKFTDMTTYVEDKETGEKSAIKFEPTMKGVKMTSQVLDKQGRVLSEEVSWLTPDKPNVLEER